MDGERNAVRARWGEARLRVSAVAAAKRAIDKILTPKKRLLVPRQH
jgi:hypothetical protein